MKKSNIAAKEKRLFGLERLQGDDASFARRLETAMGSEDWRMQFDLFHNAKEGSIVDCDYRKLDIPDLPFDVATIEDHSEMVMFTDIFPSALILPAMVDGTEFLVLDQYCVRKDCGCRSVVLSFVPVVDGRGLLEHQQALYEYRSGKVEIIPPLQAGRPRPERIIEAMIAVNGQAAKELAKRHSAIRLVYRRFLEKRETRRAPVDDLRVGRNDPCPCGSGKKYMRCHGA